jgi:hypothetical protein
VLVVAAFVRIYQLELRPMHHDEGVNGFFLMNLIRTGIFRYDPSNYHGPTLFYFTLPLASAAQHFQMLGTWVVRIVPCRLRRRHRVARPRTAPLHRGGRRARGGRIARALSGLRLLLALLHPRDDVRLFHARHRRGAFAFLRIQPRLLCRAGRRLRRAVVCDEGDGFYFGGSALDRVGDGVGLHGFCQRAGMVCAARAGEQARLAGRERKGCTTNHRRDAADGLVERFGGWPRIAILSGVALGIFLFVNVLFYSSFFTNAKGVSDSLKAFDIWTKTGRSTFHGKPFYTYVNWLWQEESPLLLLAVMGAVIALWQMRNRFALFRGLVGLRAARRLFAHQLQDAVAHAEHARAARAHGGYAINTIYRTGGGRDRMWRVVALVALGSGLVICAYQSYMLNLVHYDDDRYIYVYAHTKREYLDLIRQVDETAARIGTKYDTSINVAAPEYWPMPWYLRDYKSVGYAGRCRRRRQTTPSSSPARRSPPRCRPNTARVTRLSELTRCAPASRSRSTRAATS